jgi:hypothetical protein
LAQAAAYLALIPKFPEAEAYLRGEADHHAKCEILHRLGPSGF